MEETEDPPMPAGRTREEEPSDIPLRNFHKPSNSGSVVVSVESNNGRSS
jgi:hypothetical protein